ncbi:hypothetical protein EXS70_04205 [Candidatus Peribacteria bacterium]|nr:hypothetical protein [Candidatus Peribacteria bacterium]
MEDTHIPHGKNDLSHLVSDAVQAAEVYDGTENSFRKVLQLSTDLEERLLSLLDKQPLTAEAELAAQREQGVANPQSISAILSTAQKNLDKLLNSTENTDDLIQKLEIVFENIEAVLVPPGEQEVQKGDGGGEWKKLEFEPRLQHLIQALQQNNIFTDDLIITKGILRPNMMRKEGYVLVEIPRIGREVLVCNQVGEATFVSSRRLGIQTYTRSTKHELEQIEGVERVVSPGIEGWAQEVMTSLLRDATQDSKKIDVRDVQALRREILLQYPTPQLWLAQGKKKFSAISGKGIRAIATAFDIRTDPREPLGFAVLSAAIYGEGDADIMRKLSEEREWSVLSKDPAKLVTEVKKLFPTSTDWASMTLETKKEMRIAGYGLEAIASALDLSWDETARGRYGFAKLGLLIYGKNDVKAKELFDNEEEWRQYEADGEKFKQTIKKKFPTGKEWMAMPGATRRTLLIANRGFRSFANILCPTLSMKNPSTVPLEFAQLGIAIYGKDDQAIITALKNEEEWKRLKNEPALLRGKLLELYPDKEKFLNVLQEEVENLSIAGRGIVAIAGALGVLAGTTIRRNVKIALAKAIFGDDKELDTAAKEELEWTRLSSDKELLKSVLRAKFPSGRSWMEMTYKQKRETIAGRGLAAIATALGCSQLNPRDRVLDLANMGQEIYGKDDPDIRQVLEG